MTKRRRKPKTALIWASGIALALVVHGAGLFLFRVGDEKERVAEPDLGFVSIPPAEVDGRLLREWAYLFDSAPLYFPTRWNASSNPQVVWREQQLEPLFTPFPARLSYGERDFGLGAIITARKETPLESLAAFEDPIYAVFGKGEVRVPVFEERFAQVEVMAPGEEKPIFETVVSAEGAPSNGGQLWVPAEFLVQVIAIGHLGEPILVRGTGFEAIDRFLITALRQLLHEQMLPPGYYRVRAGP